MHERRLPHWEQGNVFYFVTWHQGDSLPQTVLREFREGRERWLTHNPEPWTEAQKKEFRQRFVNTMEQWLDKGAGSCLLRQADARESLTQVLHQAEPERVEIASYVLMPNHVHILFQIRNEHKLTEVIRAWKSFSAREINRVLRRSGPIWEQEYWDTLIRDERHWFAVRRYIRENPRKARLPEGTYTLFER